MVNIYYSVAQCGVVVDDRNIGQVTDVREVSSDASVRRG